MRRRNLVLATAATAVLTVGIGSGRAQVATPGAPMGSAQARIAESVAIDSFLALLPPRENEQIEAEVERSFRLEREGSERKSRAERTRSYVRAMREVQEKEVERVKRESDIAKDLGEASRRALLDSERKLRERYRDLLGDRAEALKREADLGDQQVKHARALRKRLDEERKVEADRREWTLLNAPDVPARADAASRRQALQKSILERLKDYYEVARDEAREAAKLADREDQYADKLTDVIERRRKLFEN